MPVPGIRNGRQRNQKERWRKAENKSGIARRFPVSDIQAHEAARLRRPVAGGSKIHRGSGWIRT